MRIILEKLSLTHHRLQVVRDDGTLESAQLESRTFAPHDFIHYSLESIAGLQRSFWGLVASGHSFVEMNAKDAMKGERVPKDELGITEMVAGALTKVAGGTAEDAPFLEVMTNAFAAYDLPVPDYLTPEFLAAFRRRMRALLGEWKALRKGRPMTLDWPDPAARAL